MLHHYRGTQPRDIRRRLPLSLQMKKMAAGVFKANCLAVMDEVQSKRVTVVITKRGKPVAKLVPVGPQVDDIFGFLRGKIKITGDIVSPALTPEE